jgi:hypothetical protein
MARKTRTRTTRDERRELRAAQRATERATHQSKEAKERAEVAAAIEADELATSRVWETGAVAYSPHAPELDDDDPFAGLRRERDRISKLYDKRAAELNHAGVNARPQAERNLDALWRELLAVNEQIDEREANAAELGELVECRAFDCYRTLPRRKAFYQSHLCSHHWNQSGAARRARITQPTTRPTS